MTDDQTYGEIQQIRAELRDHGGILRSLLYAQAGHITEEILAQMTADPLLARVFLLVDGLRSQRDIVMALADQDISGASQSTVSRRMSRLTDDFGLIAPIGRGAEGGVAYQTTPVAEALKVGAAARRIIREVESRP